MLELHRVKNGLYRSMREVPYISRKHLHFLKKVSQHTPDLCTTLELAPEQSIRCYYPIAECEAEVHESPLTLFVVYGDMMLAIEGAPVMHLKRHEAVRIPAKRRFRRQPGNWAVIIETRLTA